MAKKDKKTKKKTAIKDDVENAVSTNVFGGNVAVTASTSEELAARLAESSTKSPRGDADYMNFSGKTGMYSIGKDKRDAISGEEWIVNVASFTDGYVMWKNSVPAFRMANVIDPPVATPDPDEGGPFTGDSDGWFPAKGFSLKSLGDGTQAEFNINSKGGVSAIADFQKLIADRIVSGDPAWPVVTLSKEQFTSGGFKNFKPSFEVDRWLTDDEINDMASE